MRAHGNLEVWNKPIDFVVRIYKTTEAFPAEEKFGLTSQLRRASISIPSNIAEGAARTSKKEFPHFLSNSQGSASEVSTQLFISLRLGFIDQNLYQDLNANLNEIGKMIAGLSQHLRRA